MLRTSDCILQRPSVAVNRVVIRRCFSYRRRHRVEISFCRIKHFRRIATRYDQTESTYAMMIRVVAIWLALA